MSKILENLIEEIELADSRIRDNILTTPLIESRFLSRLIDGSVLLKLESEQHTGSFKARGSLNKLMSLNEAEKNSGVVTASTGNHAQGFARACEITNTAGTICLPENASKAKVEALKFYDTHLEFYGNDSLQTELHAKQQALKTGRVWVSPYNDMQVIAGQGTIGIELCEQSEHLDSVLITVGGGGLISGIGSYLKSKAPGTKIIACQPENSPEMKLSLEAGRIVQLPEYLETLSDGSAGGIEDGSITFDICREIVDTTFLATENEIAEAIKLIAHRHHKIIEGAAGVAVASLIKNADQFKGQTVAIIICGSNISIDNFRSLI